MNPLWSYFLLLSIHSIFMNIAIYFVYRISSFQNKLESHLGCRDVGRRYGGGHQSGGSRKWSCWKVQYDSAILQGDFYKRLQENYWCRFPGKTNPVGIKQMPYYWFLPFLLFLCSLVILRFTKAWNKACCLQSTVKGVVFSHAQRAEIIFLYFLYKI